MADGKVVIEADLDSSGIESALNGLQGNLKGISKLGDIFDLLTKNSKSFGTAFSAASKLVSSGAATAIAGVVALGVAFIKLYEVSKQNFAENITNIGNSIKPVIDIVKSFGNELMTMFSNVTGFEFSFSSLISEAVEFESTMASVAAVMNATGDGISQITQTARLFGAETRYSAIQVADAFTYMGMAGFSANEAVSSMVDVLNLSTIGTTSLATSSDIVTDGLTQLGMSANQAGNFVDMMAATITSSNTNVEMMGNTLQYAGSIAGTLGIDMADLSVAIGLMADSGIKASNSGTALRTLMTNLSAPTDTVAGAMEQYGINLITATDGSVDLSATLVGLRKSLKDLPLTEQAEAAKALAGKTGMGGLLSIVNATDERYQELTDSINNSTQSVSYWNENCAITRKVGEEATNSINMMKEAYEGSETAAAALNLRTQDLALAVQVLGADSEVTSNSVNDLLNVFSSMRLPTKENAKAIKELGLTYREVNDDIFDYNKTCASIDSSIIGLSQSQKEQMKSQLNTNMSLEQANKVLKQYDMTAKSASTGQIDMISNLEQLRNTFGGMDEATRKAKLEQMGLGSAIEEVNELVSMTDEEFKLYCDNLELATGLADKMANAMDETTKNGLLSLSSALSDVGIEAFENFKGTLNGATGALNTFFETWRNAGGGEFNYSFDSFNLALDGLLNSIKNANISGAIGEAISNASQFIIGGSLSTILDIGTEIITQICNGIKSNKTEIETAISSAISQISGWVQANSGQIGEAGQVILEAIGKGISDNTSSIHSALESVASTMNGWISSSDSIKSMAGSFSDIFINSFFENMSSKISSKMGEFFIGSGNLFTKGIGGFFQGTGAAVEGVFNNIMDFLFPTADAAGEETGEVVIDSTARGMSKYGYKLIDTSKSALKKAGEGAVEGAKEGVAPLVEVMALTNATQVLQQSATDMYNGAKNSFSKLGTIAKESMTGMYLGVQTSMNAATLSVKQSATDMYLGASNSFVGLRDAITTQFISISNVVSTQMSNTRNILTSQMLSMSAVTRAQSSAIRDGITTKFISINAVVRTQITEARNAFTSQMLSMSAVCRAQASAIRNTITSQFISINNVVRTQITEARNAFTSQMLSMSAVARTQSSSILSTFRNCASQMQSIGVQMGAGLRNGLASQRGSILATASGIANSVASTMRKALDIHSPSRVTKEIGVDTVRGLEVGVIEEQPNLQKITGQSISSMIDKMKNSIDVSSAASQMKSAVDMETYKVSASISANSNYIPTDRSKGNDIKISEDDIEKLSNAISEKDFVVYTQIDEKVVAKTIGSKVNEVIGKINKRSSRLAGEV